jgi:hypothetical protein
LVEGLAVTLKEGLKVGLENEMVGLDDGLPAELTGLVESLAVTGFLVGVDVGLDGLVEEGRLLGDKDAAETCQL